MLINFESRSKKVKFCSLPLTKTTVTHHQKDKNFKGFKPKSKFSTKAFKTRKLHYRVCYHLVTGPVVLGLKKEDCF